MKVHELIEALYKMPLNEEVQIIAHDSDFTFKNFQCEITKIEDNKIFLDNSDKWDEFEKSQEKVKDKQ